MVAPEADPPTLTQPLSSVTLLFVPCAPETGAEPSLQATQMRLKRARLADNLNEKISQRPGPMELVEKNILPVDSSVKEAIIGESGIHGDIGGITGVCLV